MDAKRCLLTGVVTKIGFKAISEDGKGVHISGKVLNSKQQEVARFMATHAGMGSFELTPLPGERYTAQVSIGTLIKNYPLPVVNMVGTALRITQSRDSFTYTVNASGAVNSIHSTDTPRYYLIGQARGVVCYAQRIMLNSRLTQTIAKNLFPTCVCRFTLLDAYGHALNERQILVDHGDNLDITISPNKIAYNKRDSVA